MGHQTCSLTDARNLIDYLSQQSQKEITVRVLFFGAARDSVGDAEINLTLSDGTKSSEAFEQVLNRFPNLRRFGRSLLFAVNEEYAVPERVVVEGDELAVFPPVSGGANHDFFEITTAPLDVGSIARRVVLPECGATVTLDGYAREWTRGRQTLHLVYEAYAPMAIKEMEKLGRAAHEQFEIAHIGIVHRTGKLQIGETSVVIAVSAPHRRAAFAACEWAIRELKRTVPIWKKEVFADGEVWVEGDAEKVSRDSGD